MLVSKISVGLAVFFAAGGMALRVDGAPAAAPPGPVTTDAELIAAINLDSPGLEKMKAAVRAGDFPAAKVAYLVYRRTFSPVKWKTMASDEPVAPVEATDSTGDAICEHQIPDIPFHIYGNVADMGKNFDWYKNPVSPSSPNYTVEFTWCVVGRTLWWESLADAYWKTHNEKYAVEWVNELNDFVTKVPMPDDTVDVESGSVPSIWRGLETSVRMYQSWPYAYFRFLNSPSFTPDAQWTYLKSCYEHGLRLKLGLQNHERSGNHVTSEAYGLYSVGALYPELRNAEGWRKDAVERLTFEMNRIVPPDGMEAELTPTYHVGAMDECLGPLQLAKLNHLPIPAEFTTKIMSMYRALVLIMDQEGHDVPTNDSEIIDARWEAKRGLQLADDPLLKWAASKGAKGVAPPASTMLAYAGFYAMRSGWNPDDLFLFFRAGPIGIGHEHQDMLQVDLNAWGKKLLIDEGRHAYDQSILRYYCLGTSAHNTVIVDGKWQHRPPNKPTTDPQPVSNPWVVTPLFDYVDGTYDQGYQTAVYDPHKQYMPLDWAGKPDFSVSHTRRVLFLKPAYALVVDTLDGTGTHTFDAHFHLDAPKAKIDPETQAAFSLNTDHVQVGLYPLERENLVTNIIQGQKDPPLGWIANETETRPIPTVRFRKHQDAPAIFATFLYPYQGESAPSFKTRPLVTGDNMVWSRAIDTAQEKMEVILVKNGASRTLSFRSALLGQIHLNATGLVIRQPASGRQIFVGGWDWKTYDDSKTQFVFDTPGNAVLTAQETNLIFFNGDKKPLKVTVAKPFTRTVSLPAGAWTSISNGKSEPASPPRLFESGGDSK
jgi:hypothetical protein